MSWVEGIPPSIINDNVRAMMARIAEWRNDTSGLLVATGTPPAYSLTTYEGLQTPTPSNGQGIVFFPTVTNVGADTLTCDGGNAYPIQSPAGVPIAGGVMVAFTPYEMTFITSSNCWVLRQITGQPLIVPIGAMLDWTGGPPPNSNFVMPFGQAISRTTYATYFSLVSTTYGSGDGSTTFNVPDVRGRVVAGIDNMGGFAAGRIGTLATDGGTIVGTTPGSAGGSQNHVQTQAEMASHSHTGSGNVSDPQHHHEEQGSNIGGPANFMSANEGNSPSDGNMQTLPASTGITVPSLNINNAGNSNAMALLQPTIMLNKILRVL